MSLIRYVAVHRQVDTHGKRSKHKIMGDTRSVHIVAGTVDGARAKLARMKAQNADLANWAILPYRGEVGGTLADRPRTISYKGYRP